MRKKSKHVVRLICIKYYVKLGIDVDGRCSRKTQKRRSKDLWWQRVRVWFGECVNFKITKMVSGHCNAVLYWILFKAAGASVADRAQMLANQIHWGLFKMAMAVTLNFSSSYSRKSRFKCKQRTFLCVKTFALIGHARVCVCIGRCVFVFGFYFYFCVDCHAGSLYLCIRAFRWTFFSSFRF